ncbi:MAG TPA: DUF1073 domain-containing protein, partial [Candidatus Lokiarchaeia archaeon]
EELHIKSKINELIKLGRLYGGAILVLGPLDRGKPEQPLDENNIQNINSLNVLSRYQLNILKRYSDPMQNNYNQPELYSLQLTTGQSSIPAIHESRVIKFDGAYLPENVKLLNQYWCDSELQPIYEELKRFGVSLQSGSILFHDFITKLLKIPNLKELLSTQEGKSAVDARIQYAITNMSSAGIVICETDEDFNKIQTPITGLVELMKIYIEVVSAASKIPITILFSQALGTLAGATETTRGWYDTVSDYQEKKVRPALERLIKLFFLSKDFITKGKEPESWSFVFNPLWQQTEKETVETRKIQADMDAVYIGCGVYSPEDVTRSRFGGKYSFETTVDIEEMEAIKENEKDMEILRLSEELEKLKNVKTV